MPAHDPHDPKPGTSYHRSNRHRNRDNRKQWLGEQWEAARLFIPASGDAEYLIESFPGTDEGKALAWLLSDALRAKLIEQGLAGNGVSVRVDNAPRLHVGIGVWVVLGKEGKEGK